jgi:hypothetical protein
MLVTEPRDLLLGKDNDLVVTTDLDWSRGIPGVMQECRIRMRTFQGEWFLDLETGIPYWTEILGQKPKLAVAALGASLTEALLAIEDVVEVVLMDVQYDRQTRSATVRWSVLCVFGTTPVDTLKI